MAKSLYSDEEKQRAKAMGLLSAGLGMLAQSSRPFGQSPVVGIAQGLQIGLNSYNDTMGRILTEREANTKLLRDEQMQEALGSLVSSLPESQRAAAMVDPKAAARSMFPSPETSGLLSPDVEAQKIRIKQAGEIPRTRLRYEGHTAIQEEMTPDGWRQIGSRPTFAPQQAINLQYGAPFQGEDIGLPEGSIVQRGPKGEIKPIFTPSQEKPLTAGQARAELLAPGATRALEEFKALLGQYDPTGIEGTKDTMLSGSIMNALVTEKGQQYNALGRELVANLGYGKSGANLTENEWETGRQTYLPQPGDKEATIRQKLRALESGVAGLRAALRRPTDQMTVLPQQGGSGVTSSGMKYRIIP